MTHEELAKTLCDTLGKDMVKLIASAIKEAVAAERERCARIADNESDSVAGRAIASRIRNGSEA